MSKRILPFIPQHFVVERVLPHAAGVSIVCRTRRLASRCPTCRSLSARTHSHYERRIADLPWQGRSVTLCFQARRLRCGNRRCARRTFAERAEDAVRPHARGTLRLREIQRSVGLALGGEAGARLVERLGMRASADTMLRMVRSRPSSLDRAPRILGVDDWAWRRRIRSHPVSHRVYRVVVGLVGLLIVVGGLALVPLPGPGWIIVLIGLAVLASEFVWAHRLLQFARHRLHVWGEWLKPRPWWVKGLVGLGTAVLVAAFFYLLFLVSGVPGFFPDRVEGWLATVPGLDGSTSPGPH